MSGGLFGGTLPGRCIVRGMYGCNMKVFGYFHGGNVWGNCSGGCPDPHAGLQMSTCSSYDLFHPG